MTQKVKRTIRKSEDLFADLGVQEPETETIRADLTHQLYLILKRRGLTQVAAAKLLGLSQPDVSKLMRGRYTGFSTDRLFQLLRRLGQEVEIVIRGRRRGGSKKTKIRVLAA